MRYMGIWFYFFVANYRTGTERIRLVGRAIATAFESKTTQPTTYIHTSYVKTSAA